MTSLALPAAAVAAALLLLLALRLRGPRGGRDLTGPPRPKRKRIGSAEAARLVELVERGEQAEALRLMRGWGYGEEDGRKMLRFVARLEGKAEADGGGEGASG